MQVYLPDDLYEAVKKRGLPASELLQEAVRRELRRRDLLDEADEWIAEGMAEHGEPSAEDWAAAEASADRIAAHRAERAAFRARR